MRAPLPSEDAVLLLLFVLRCGQIVLRRIVGWQDIPSVASQQSEAA